jgi:hypothetical protein
MALPSGVTVLEARHIARGSDGPPAATQATAGMGARKVVA